MNATGLNDLDRLTPPSDSTPDLGQLLNTDLPTVPPAYLYSGSAREHWDALHSGADYHEQFTRMPVDSIADRIRELTATRAYELVWLGVGNSRTELIMTDALLRRGGLQTITIHDSAEAQVKTELGKFEKSFPTVHVRDMCGDFHALNLRDPRSQDCCLVAGMLGLTITNISDLDLLMRRYADQLNQNDLFVADFVFVRPDIMSGSDDVEKYFSVDEVRWFKSACESYLSEKGVSLKNDILTISFVVKRFDSGYCVDVRATAPELPQPLNVIRLVRLTEEAFDKIFKHAGFTDVFSIDTGLDSKLKIFQKM